MIVNVVEIFLSASDYCILQDKVKFFFLFMLIGRKKLPIIIPLANVLQSNLYLQLKNKQIARTYRTIINNRKQKHLH